MAEQIPNQPVQAAPEDEFEKKFQARLKEKYGIEEDPDTFRSKREAWTKAEAELPQYQQTLQQVIQYVKENEERFVQKAVQQAPEQDDEERLRALGKLDPYEMQKRVLAKKEQELEAKMQQYSQQSVQQAEYQRNRMEGLRRAHEQVTQSWPEAFDQNSPLHKEGKKIFQQEMSPGEKEHPMAFLIATERAAGRLGIAPKGRRGNSARREQVAAQSVSRDAVRADGPDDDDKPLNARQKQVAAGIGVDEKTYKAALKTRREQSSKAKKDED